MDEKVVSSLLKDELEKHLNILKRQSFIEAWHDRRIGAGEEFIHAINQNLETANVILLLVSADFLASDYCYDIEMKRAMERHEAGETRVIPVILRPCDWHDAPFGKLKGAPPDGKPVTRFPTLDDAFVLIVADIIPRLRAEKEALSGQLVGTKSTSFLIRTNLLPAWIPPWLPPAFADPTC